MEEKLNVTEIESAEVQADAAEKDTAAKDLGFKFFKNCSQSLKRFSVILFVMNLFLIVVLTIVGFVFAAVYLNTQIVTILFVPGVCVFAIGVLFARFLSALVYGFAEIVEKYEGK